MKKERSTVNKDKMSGHSYSEWLTKEFVEKIYLEHGELKPAARELKINPETLRKYMNSYDLERKQPALHKCNFDFFKNDTEEVFYWAGMLASDGSVTDKGKSKNCISLGLATKDIAHLEKYKTALQAEHPIYSYVRKNPYFNTPGKHAEFLYSSELKIYSVEMVEDLKRFNIGPRKSITYTIPDWMKEHQLRRHFLRGLYDGDGHLGIAYPPNSNVLQYKINISGSLECVSEVKNILENDLGGLRPKIPSKDGEKNCYVVSYGGNKVFRRIYEYLYKDSTIYLDRKFNLGQGVYNMTPRVEIDNYLTVESVTDAMNKYVTFVAAAESLKISSRALRSFMVRNGIHDSSTKRNKEITDTFTNEMLQECYDRLGSIAAVSKEVGVNSDLIRNSFIEFGVKYNTKPKRIK